MLEFFIMERNSHRTVTSVPWFFEVYEFDLEGDPLVVLGIGLNFIIDHLFCKTDRLSINNRLVENISLLI